MPVEERDGGNVVVETDLLGESPTARVVEEGAGTHVAHFAVCPEAKGWRKRDG